MNTTRAIAHAFARGLAKSNRMGLAGLNVQTFGGDNVSAGGAVLQLAALGMTISNFYHGYKRNNSLGWGLGWVFLGPIGIALSLVQGYGKPI